MSLTVPVVFTPNEMVPLVQRIREPLFLVSDKYNRVGLCPKNLQPSELQAHELSPVGSLPPCYPEWLGDRAFNEIHGLRFPYVAGAMARGIATADMVINMAKGGMLGFFGAAGLSLVEIERNINRIEGELAPQNLSWGTNLIHMPADPELERATCDLYLRKNVRRVSAAAFMNLTPNLVRYAYRGLSENQQGGIERKNFLFAKVSRPEVAQQLMAPAPKAMLDKLVAAGDLTEQEARLGLRLPVAEDFHVEADSGGHTDNRSMAALFPMIMRLRAEAMTTYGYTRPIRLGAGGGLGTPQAVAGAFALGASYVFTGSINQAAVESGLDEYGKERLVEASMADVMMAPCADMFEMGVKVQVLKKGFLYGQRASKLYELYTGYDSFESIPASLIHKIEKDIFQASIEEIWEKTRSYFESRQPREIERAEKEPKYRMALVFRWYLGHTSQWAISGEPTRRMDYQIWCGPAMGAFNNWVKGSFLEKKENRLVVQIAKNMLEGAACVTRAQQLRSFGLPLPIEAFEYRPEPLS